MPCALSDFARSSEPVIDPIARLLMCQPVPSEDTRILVPCLARPAAIVPGPERWPDGRWRVTLGPCAASLPARCSERAVLVSCLSPTSAPVQAAETYTQESLDHHFRLEWSKTGRNVNGYVYNSSNRRAAHMQLLVEGLAAAGTVATKTTTWVRDVPP